MWFAAQLPAHPHVLKYANAWEENGYLFIQTELCEVGSLKVRKGKRKRERERERREEKRKGKGEEKKG